MMPGGTIDSGALQVSSLHEQLVDRNILQEHVVLVRGTTVQLYLLANAGCRSCEYMVYNFKLADGNPNKICFDLHVIIGRVYDIKTGKLFCSLASEGCHYMLCVAQLLLADGGWRAW